MTNSENMNQAANNGDSEFGRFLVWNNDGGFARQELESALHLRPSAAVETEKAPAASHG